MPSKVSTLTCQVDGLKMIYVRSKAACFEFENAKQLNKAREKATAVYQINPPFKLCLHSKKPIFAFSISGKPIRTVLLKATTAMATEYPRKTFLLYNTKTTSLDIFCYSFF